MTMRITPETAAMVDAAEAEMRAASDAWHTIRVMSAGGSVVLSVRVGD